MIQFMEIQKALKKNRKKLLKKNLQAVGIGYKIVDCKPTGELSIVCSVGKKLPLSEIKKKDLVPKQVDLNPWYKKYQGVKTDVVEVGEIKALHTEKHRPAMGGISIGHVDITAGTLGCAVKGGELRYILSNSHVLAMSGDANLGDDIIQPGAHDGGTVAEDHLAELSAHVPINFSGIPSECPISGIFTYAFNGILKLIGSKTRLQSVIQAEANLVDAAIARPLKDADLSDEIMEVGNIAGVKSAILGMKIKKSGRTTGITTGEITQVDVTVNVQYGEGKIATFEDQIMAGPISKGGDSGSAVLTEDNYLCGLLFAGSDEVTICNRIENVFELLNIRL